MAARVTSLLPDALPDDVVAKAKLCILDHVAAVTAIADLEAMSSVTPLLDLIQRFQALSRAGQESLVTFAGK
jgi:hypothetical protein